MALYGVFAMNAASKSKGMVAICAIVFLLVASSARSQEAARPLTIADCPAGYVLAVQDMAEPQPLVKPPDPTASGSDQTEQDAIADAQQQAAAPRRFVTGCIPPAAGIR
jgi:hypothetical protein